MEKFTAEEIITKLIGPINPVGKSEVDAERFENLKAMCELVNTLVTNIDHVSYHYRNDYETSIKNASEYAGNFLTKTLGIS